MRTPTCLLGGPGIEDRVAHGHDPDRFVEIGSLSKVFTGTVLAALAGQGALDPDAPLHEILPEVPRTSAITPRRLAEHTSGLPRLLPVPTGPPDDPYADFTETALRDALRDLEALRRSPAGEEEEYSNLGYAVLGLALTTATGRTYQELVDAHVLRPLDLAAGAVTARPPGDLRLVPRTLLGRPRPLWNLTGAILPSGGLWATPRTMARVLVGLLVERRLGAPAPTWRRAGPTLWHNGATRDASVVAAAHDDGRWLLLHRFGDPAKTDRLAVATLTAAPAPAPRPDIR
ncbi:serine hydrolase domain-containing protein [Streptomyces sp. t39]|uniref:serine hydrolase domain-containing protein n=1 Tax=Streptomyces sp. t39 TaxID=1828156 RepID=UPI0011CE40C3|nr:serine hydrolase domain-containing protein [Streptomyces sp. t39]TXS55817.1 class A beta-lactamase-related serine hydrolase [Streptomyces sp. t39]